MGQRKMLLWLVAVAVLLAGCQSSPKTSRSTAPGLADGGYVQLKAPDGLSAPISPLSSPDATVAMHPVPPVGTNSYQPPVLPVLVASPSPALPGWGAGRGLIRARAVCEPHPHEPRQRGASRGRGMPHRGGERGQGQG